VALSLVRMTTTTPERSATYSGVLAHQQFRVLFISRFAAIIADTLRILALSVLVYATTGSALLAAVTYGIGFLPQAVGGMLIGSLADRLPPRRLLVAGYLIEAVVALLLAGLQMPVPIALCLVAAVACVTPVFNGASSRLVAATLSGDSYVLGRSMSSMSSSAGQLLGLAAGGATIAALGARAALAVCAALHLTAAGMVRLRLDSHPAAVAARRLRGTVTSTLRGNRQLLTDRRVRALLLAHWLPAGLSVGAEALLVPYTTVRHLPAGSTGLLLAALPIGMLLGDLVVGRLLKPQTRERAAPWLVALLGGPLLVFLSRPGLLISLVVLAAAGCGFSYTLGLQRMFLAVLPAELQGQAFTLLSTGMMTAQGLGPVLFGAFAVWASVPAAMATSGLLVACTSGVVSISQRRDTKP